MEAQCFLDHGYAYSCAVNVPWEIARSKVVYGAQDEYGLAFIPSQRPVITWEKNELNIDIEPAQADFYWNVSSKPDAQLLHSNSLTITMVQYPQININYVGDTNMPSSFDARA